MLQVNSETDFATKTEHFQSMVQTVASAALALEGTGGPYPKFFRGLLGAGLSLLCIHLIGGLFSPKHMVQPFAGACN